VKKILNCDLHDYLEIACLFKFTVELTVDNNERYIGIPISTRVHSDSAEYLDFTLDKSTKKISIPLLSLQRMTALSYNPHFSSVLFKAIA